VERGQWFSLAERSLIAEEKQQFCNLKGRKYFFADFMLQHLRSFPPSPEHSKVLARLQNIYNLYPLSNVAERRAYVTETRTLLEHLRGQSGGVAEVVRQRIRQEMANHEPQGDWRDNPVQFVKGVGPKMAEQLTRVDIHTIGDLLHYYPRKHLDYSQCTRIRDIKVGETATVMGYIVGTSSYTPPGKEGLTIIKVNVRDSSGQLTLSWFAKGGNKYLRGQYEKRFPEGSQILLSGIGKWDKYSKRITLDRVESEVLGDLEDLESLGAHKNLHLGRLVPVYPLSEGLNIKFLRRAIHAALSTYGTKIEDPFPTALRTRLSLMSLGEALHAFHFPQNGESLAQARRRLVFQELLMTQLGLGYKRKQRERYETGIAFAREGHLRDPFLAQLPFTLTGAQQRVYEEIMRDLDRPEPMSRLVQGDVGSGKTVVAVLALLRAVENGYQGALMAPTEILAEQHYQKLFDWLYALGLRTELLIGGQGAKTRREALARLASGEAHVAVGTHALIQQGVTFQKLGLAVIDEQHRFGVKQRAELKRKGLNPEILTMTATPIPRTLALSLYGDLDVSLIDELPPGRKPIATQLAKGRQREQVWQLMRHELEAGHQCYVVFPLVEESEKMDLKAATVEFEHYRTQLFPQFRVGLLHGKMKGADKEHVMRAFVRHELDILVATTVIEVGVDVPNASVMVIEHAERFGLAQLHQLRGRVGRGADKAYCFLLADKLSELAQERLKIFTQTTNGFVIAEQDLRLRGPGEFLGTRQSGMPDLVLTNLSEDTALLELAREEALSILKSDPELTHHLRLKQELFRFFRRHMGFLEA
jgi:ATP-dependent DNA helicase RecG